MEKPKLVFLVICISLVGIFGIYAYAVMIEEKTVPIADLGSKYIGSMVEVEGHIKEIKTWQDGDLSIILVDYESGKSVEVNVDSDAVKNLDHQDKLIPGAKIRVSGLVEDYKGEILIHVMSSEGIELLQTAANNIIPLNVILERPEVFEGVQVVVRGDVWNIEEIESLNAFTFTLQNTSDDGYYSVNCIIFNLTQFVDRDDMWVQYGSEVIFTGILEYYQKQGIWQIQSYEGKASLEIID